MMNIVQSPHTVLSHKAKAVKKFDKVLKMLLADMEKTLRLATDPEGVGLAAPQIGKSLQIFIARQTPKSPLLTCINPKIKDFFDERKKKSHPLVTQKSPTSAKKEREKGVQLEGCLSIKDVWGVVKRHDALVLSYQDEHGEHHTKKFDGFMATIIQHEYDHLQGILFPKRVLEQKNPLYRSSKNAKGETEFEEIKL